MPADILLSVALLQAYCLEGDGSAAVDLALALWNRRHAIARDAALTYAAALTHLAMYELALEFVQANEPAMQHPIGVFVATHAAWGLGDIEALRSGLDRDASSHRDAWNAVISQLEKARLLPSLRTRQQIVSRHLFRKQTGLEVVITADDSGSLELAQYAFVAGGHDERLRLEEAIYADLASFYRSTGLGDVDFWSPAPVLVLDVQSRSIQIEGRVPEAA